MDEGVTRICIGASMITKLMKSKILEKRSCYPGMIQSGSKVTAAGSFSSTIFPYHAMTERHSGGMDC